MWNLQQRKTAIDMRTALNSLYHKKPVTPLKTDNPKTEVFVNLGMKPKRSKPWDMKWHYFRYNEFIDKLRVYCNRGTKNDADCFTKHHPPIYRHQMQSWYIHISNLVSTIPHTVRLCEGVLIRIPVTQSHADYLKTIQAKPQSLTNKFHTVIRLNRPR